MNTNMWLARRWWLLPVSFIIVAGSVATNLGQGGPHDTGVGARIAAVAVAAVATACLFLLDRWPMTLLAIGFWSGSYFAIGGENGPIFFVLIVACFVVSTRRHLRVWLPLLIGAAVLLWAGLLIRGLRTDDLVLGAWQAMGIGALVSAATAIGAASRQRRASWVDRTSRAAAEERLRMAQDLHDGVGHGLAVIAMQAGVALHVLERDPAKARESLEAIRATSKESLSALRSELATMAGQDVPLRPTQGLADLPALLERVTSAGLAVRTVGEPGELTDASAAVVFAVIQEALTNVLRHAQAMSVTITWAESVPGMVSVSVADDGRGGSVQDEGMGVAGMRSRVSALGGTFRAGPRHAGQGFEVAVELPR